jgi:hypothetical protein
LDVNQARVGELVRLLEGLGALRGSADSAANAILDWRDADDVPRDGGAEREWYSQQGRVGPRNDAFGAPEEIELVRALADFGLADSLTTVEESRIAVNAAPLVVLGSLPGIGAEILSLMAERRQQGRMLRHLAELGEGISQPARDTLMSYFAELASRLTIVPEAWHVIGQATVGKPPTRATVELRLTEAAGRAAISRRREW